MEDFGMAISDFGSGAEDRMETEAEPARVGKYDSAETRAEPKVT